MLKYEAVTCRGIIRCGCVDPGRVYVLLRPDGSTVRFLGAGHEAAQSTAGARRATRGPSRSMRGCRPTSAPSDASAQILLTRDCSRRIIRKRKHSWYF